MTHKHRTGSARRRRTALLCVLVCCVVLIPSVASASRLLQFRDSTGNYIAAGSIASLDITGWNDPVIYTGDVVDNSYHILVAIKDTAKFQALFGHCNLDSAKLAITIGGKAGTPGNIGVHWIRRGAAGRGVYPAYDDSWPSYCRSSWRNRKSANSTSCPDSIPWQTPGATGAGDYNAAPFATLPAPVSGGHYEIDVTPWIAGIINKTDSVSNGIMLLATGADGVGADYFGIRNIWPFCSGNDCLSLKVWVSNWDWVKVCLDSNRTDDGWIAADNTDTIFSDNGYLKVGTGAGTPLQKYVGVVFPDDSALFGPNAIPEGYRIDSARFWCFVKNTFTAPNDTIALGEILPAAAFTRGSFPTWDSVASGIDWIGGQWSTANVVRRSARYVSSVNAWYVWSDPGISAMVQRWLDSAATRHGFALWDLGPSTSKSSAWADRTSIGFAAQASSLLVWISPPLPAVARRAWIEDPLPLK